MRWITVLRMSDDQPQPGTPEPSAAAPPPTPTPTVVVGYPAAPAAQPSVGYAGPGVASLRGQVRGLRYLVIACLGLLVVLMVGLGVALAGSRTQLDALSAQVAALGEQVDSAAAPQAAQPAPQTAPQPAPQSTEVAQLGPAPELQGLDELPAGADPTGAILIGDPAAQDVVEVYIDYQCPFCQRWEQTIGKDLVDRAIQPGSGLLVKQYNLAFLGETSAELEPAGASARAASAAACVVHNDGIETFVGFSRSVFQSADPSEPPGQFTAPVLVDLAEQAGASPAAIACIEAEENIPFVSATTKAGFGRGVGGTPTVVVNGQTVGNPFTDAALLAVAGGPTNG